MLEKELNSQLDLFSQTSQPVSHRVSFSNSFFGGVRVYEKTILLVISFIITGIISFSLGVEKGKKISLTRTSARFDLAKSVPVPIPKDNTVAQEKTGNYTIQLASYQSKVLLQKEADNLRKKGFTPFVITKGNYSILCVGSFANKDTAKPLLSELRKKFRDGYIRRL